MPLAPITIEPGIYTEASGRAALGRYKDGSNVRFFKGNPEKVAGWVQHIPAVMLGICRSMISWTTLAFLRLAAFGTHEKLYLSDGVTFFDITPIASSGTLDTDPFTTADGSATVSVSDTAHGRQAGDYVDFTGSTAVGGLDMNGSWVVSAATDDDTYTIVHDTEATSAATGGGSEVAYEYEITSGTKDSILGTGFGAGGWGSGTWGDARVSHYLTIARIWSLVNWGEDVIASPVDRPIYIWLASGGTGTRAVLVSGAPAQNRRVLVSPQLRILVSAGSHDGTNPDPMLVRWSDTEDYTDFTPSPTNAAGDKRLDNGSEIIAALLSRNEIVLITDTTLYSMTLSGDSLIFNFEDKGQAAAIVGPNAACDVNGTIYAMARGAFYTYDGSITVLPCDVHSRVFGDINVAQAAKVYCARNKTKNEVLWFYPSATSNECNKVVALNYENPQALTWWLGDAPLDRTAWLDQNVFEPLPLACQPSGDNTLVHLQETGVDADTAPLPYFLETYDMEIPASSSILSGASTGPGEVIERFKRFLPDHQRIAGNHTFTLFGRKYPSAKKRYQKGPKKFGPTDERIDLHMRSRQIALRWEGSELGCDISFGHWRVDESAEGSR